MDSTISPQKSKPDTITFSPPVFINTNNNNNHNKYQNTYESPKNPNINTHSSNPMYTTNSLGINMKKFNITDMPTNYSKGQQSNFSSISKYPPVTTYISTSTLQNGIASYSIPKQKRFSTSYRMATCQSIYNLTEHKTKGITIPHSTRKDNFRKADLTPSSQDYVFTSLFDDNLRMKKGISISTKHSLRVKNK